MIKKNLIFTALATIFMVGLCHGAKQQDPTYCNPIDLDYGWGGFKQTIARASADPAIVLFKGRYYLFSTHDTGGYRVSDDLVNWKDIAFSPEIAHAALEQGRYVAPAVAADENYIYFIRLNRIRSSKMTPVIRTSDPESGKWEVCGEIRKVSDPSLFIDNGRFFIFHGLGTQQSIRCFEVDAKTFVEKPNSERLLLPIIKDVNECDAGYHFGRREMYDEIDGRQWKGKFKWLPCPEGSWIVKNNNKYYLQFATPGTISIWYSDVVMTADSLNGDFKVEPYNPVSLKVGGFIGSAGHGCVFKDKYENWWEITTMWVGNADPFERRLGLFPVTFDDKGAMKVHTYFGDYPMRVPQRKFDPEKESLVGSNLLSYNKACTPSSELEACAAELGGDENVRTWWSAKTGDKGEWFSMDLGKNARIDALQINFAEQDVDTTRLDVDYTAYLLYTSKDGKKWNLLSDQSKITRSNAHQYIELKNSVTARYLKVVNEQSMMRGKFAIRDLRVFGHGMGQAPTQVSNVRAERDKSDERFSMVKWDKVQDTDGYMVCFGYSPDHLNLAIQVKGNEKSDLMIHILTKGQPYYYRVDSYNDSGVTKGEVVSEK